VHNAGAGRLQGPQFAYTVGRLEDGSMSTMTGDRDPEEQRPLLQPRNEALVTLPRCTRCNLSYTVSKSTSALKLTYCSFLCELGDLGFSITGLEHMELKKREPAPGVDGETTAEPVATA